MEIIILYYIFSGMKTMKNKITFTLLGILTGVLNGLFGAGGGIVAVEVLKHSGLDQKKAQSTSIAVILPLCILSVIMYYFSGKISFDNMWFLIPAGLCGAAFGTYLMKKMSCELLKKIFCAFMIYAGVRMFFKG